MRKDGRGKDEIRETKIIPNFLKFPESSVYFEQGDTKLICTVSIDDKVPPFLKGTGKGWITAEYSMLPRATEKRNVRESAQGRLSGRTQEIQRMIGRSLRSVVDLSLLQERTIIIDCDVIQADGGTRTASVTAASVALAILFEKMKMDGILIESPMRALAAGISAGIVDDEILLDLDFLEDSRAQVDMNIVKTEKGEIAELQITGEGRPVGKADL
ncbi:MAG: ribonuclease PH, partial [Candidatus Aminicenantia bacterium]